MAYSKRIAPIKMVLTKREYNILVGILTDNISEESVEVSKIAQMTKDKMLKYGIPKEESNDIEIEVKLYVNETIDIISQLLIYITKRSKEIDYYQVLLKVKEKINDLDKE